MTTTRMHGITIGLMALALVSGLMPCDTPAEAGLTLDEQLKQAVDRGSPTLIKSLLDQGADVNAVLSDSGETVLIRASGRCTTEVVKLLIDRGADVNRRTKFGGTALLEAVMANRPSVVKLLLDYGTDVNAVASGSGETALMIAGDRGDLELVKLLIERDADLNAKDKSGRTVLMETAKSGRVELLKLLLDKGADVNRQTDHGWTALMFGVEAGHLKVAKPLLDRGADPNAKTRERWTPLMLAAARGHHLRAAWSELWVWLRSLSRGTVLGPWYPPGLDDPQIVKLLLQKGADVNAKDKEGWTALKRACTRGHKEIVTILKAHGARSDGIWSYFE